MTKRLSRITRVMPSRTGVRTVESFHAGNNHALNAAHSTNKTAPVAQTRRKSYCNSQLPNNAPMTAPALSCIINSEKKRPRCCGRINFTTSAERGGSNNVPPSPESRHENHSSHGSWAIPIVANPAARISIPVTIIGLAPKRSAIAPPKIPRPC
ncbi:hypothetical protein ExPCM18_00969 [Escherichia coli]|nr:hypothetical protein ExPCM18_00969 [Escherichia coli]GCO38165.1 hypothetical protein ExPCM14_02568 [Escherichia coli]GDV49711.1 hypothetical protein ExPUPEC91_00419 [Escherichia coli]